MPENDRGIGSEGLEQGGPNLGNDYSRPIGSRSDSGARDAVIVPNEKKTDGNEGTLNMDNESSRNLTSEYSSDAELEDDTDEEDDEMMEDDVLQGMDNDVADDENDEDDDENDII